MTSNALRAITTGQDMVLASLDRLGREQVGQLVLESALICPLSHRLEHIPLDLDSLITSCWVVESPEDVINDLINRHTRIFPGIQNSPIFTLATFELPDHRRCLLTGRHIAE